MKRTVVLGLVAAAILVMFTLLVVGQEKMAMPFGGDADVAFANKLWEGIEGYTEWPIKSKVYVGQSPHGAYLRMYYNVVNLDGKPYHIIIKDNYMGKDAAGNEVDLETVAKSPQKYLAAVTPMVQREDGYDSDNNDWFYAKFNPDGTIAKNPKDMLLAGRVAKGMDAGCIACHKAAKGNDYLFVNDGDM
ncbi:cytochrome P460 family protein [Candidatus Poribacteria bacterium]